MHKYILVLSVTMHLSSYYISCSSVRLFKVVNITFSSEMKVDIVTTSHTPVAITLREVSKQRKEPQW